LLRMVQKHSSNYRIDSNLHQPTCQPPSPFILSGFPHGSLLFMLNRASLSLFLSVNKPLKICNALLNRLHLSRKTMDVITYTSVTFSKTQDLQLEGGEGLKESGVKLHICRRNRRPASLKGGRWVKGRCWWWNGLLFNMSALRLGPLLALINIILLIIIFRFPVLIILNLLISR